MYCLHNNVQRSFSSDVEKKYVSCVKIIRVTQFFAEITRTCLRWTTTFFVRPRFVDIFFFMKLLILISVLLFYVCAVYYIFESNKIHFIFFIFLYYALFFSFSPLNAQRTISEQVQLIFPIF